MSNRNTKGLSLALRARNIAIEKYWKAHPDAYAELDEMIQDEREKLGLARVSMIRSATNTRLRIELNEMEKRVGDLENERAVLIRALERAGVEITT